jgi:hypothetical protein
MTVVDLDPGIAAGGAVWIASAIILAVAFWRAARRPTTLVDDYCDAIDRDLDGLPSREELQARASRIAAGMDAIGDRADRCWRDPQPPPIDAGDMLANDGIGARRGVA